MLSPSFSSELESWDIVAFRWDDTSANNVSQVQGVSSSFKREGTEI